MSKAKEIFDQLADTIPNAKKSKMFGAECIKAPNGKAVLMLWKDNLVFKLQGEALNEALSLDGAHVFSPMGDRAMTGWIVVAESHSGHWRHLAEQAMEYVSALKGK